MQHRGKKQFDEEATLFFLGGCPNICGVHGIDFTGLSESGVAEDIALLRIGISFR